MKAERPVEKPSYLLRKQHPTSDINRILNHSASIINDMDSPEILSTSMSEFLQGPQTLRFIVGSDSNHQNFTISKEAIFQLSPYFKWVFTDRGNIASQKGLFLLQDFEPQTFLYLDEYCSTGYINSLDQESAGALMELAKLWVLAEHISAVYLCNAVMRKLQPALYHSTSPTPFFYYVYSIPDRLPWTPPQEPPLENHQQHQYTNNNYLPAGHKVVLEQPTVPPMHNLKVLAMKYAAWSFSNATLLLVSLYLHYR